MGRQWAGGDACVCAQAGLYAIETVRPSLLPWGSAALLVVVRHPLHRLLSRCSTLKALLHAPTTAKVSFLPRFARSWINTTEMRAEQSARWRAASASCEARSSRLSRASRGAASTGWRSAPASSTARPSHARRGCSSARQLSSSRIGSPMRPLYSRRRSAGMRQSLSSRHFSRCLPGLAARSRCALVAAASNKNETSLGRRPRHTLALDKLRPHRAAAACAVRARDGARGRAL